MATLILTLRFGCSVPCNVRTLYTKRKKKTLYTLRDITFNLNNKRATCFMATRQDRRSVMFAS